MLIRFRMEEAYPAKNPSATGESNQTGQSVLLQEEGAHQCRSLIGSLMYAAVCTRPDNTYHIISLARHMRRPTESNWNAAKRILCYLNGTKDHSLVYGAGTVEMVGYCDSYWAGDLATRHPLLSNCMCSSELVIQTTVALSASEAEHMAASAGDLPSRCVEGARPTARPDYPSRRQPRLYRSGQESCVPCADQTH
jgi:hypothetical protein